MPIAKTATAGIQSSAVRPIRRPTLRGTGWTIVLTTGPPPGPAPGSRRAARLAAASCSRTRVTSSKKCGSSLVVLVRGCGRSTSTTPATRPGRADMTTTRVDRNTASEIECVTKTTVEPVSCQIRSSSRVEPLARHLVERAERLVHQEQASVRTTARVRSRRAAACPPESCQGWWLSNPVSSTRSIISLTRAFRRPRFQRRSSSGSEMFFATVRQS